MLGIWNKNTQKKNHANIVDIVPNIYKTIKNACIAENWTLRAAKSIWKSHPSRCRSCSVGCIAHYSGTEAMRFS
jgi:hypothetical protein